MEIDPLKNAAAASRGDQRCLPDRERPGGCSIRRGCQVIGLPRSAYYYRSAAREAALTDESLVALITEIYGGISGYGYRRVTHELRHRGVHVNHKRVARLMRERGLGIRRRLRFTETTDSTHDGPIFPNRYRNLIPARPDQVWVTDFTYIRIATGFVYLSAILDAYKRLHSALG